MPKLILSCLLFTLFIASSAATSTTFGQTYFDEFNPPRSGSYVSLFGGWTDILNIDKDIPGAPDDIAVEVKLGEGWTLGSAIGYQLTPVFRTELEIAYRDSSTIDVGGISGIQAGDAHSTAIMNNWYATAPLPSRLSPYIGLGFGVSIDEVDVDATGTGSALQFDGGNLAYQLMVGARYRLSNSMSLFSEYRYFGTDSFELKGQTENVVGHLRSHNILAGITFAF